MSHRQRRAALLRERGHEGETTTFFHVGQIYKGDAAKAKAAEVEAHNKAERKLRARRLAKEKANAIAARVNGQGGAS